ncbi:AsmA family protein [Vibrio sp. TH_r3]|uniref:AsmA family protein n=1 Tax=Vibrio sp. TH_r3 TaxID=3082084 RepID=UPI002953C0AD|nr:AsmA family protein [Vibrio sp. TH_r3]MDV7104141.1 AsmA family protein [Vibrio sp. TH_r3]
MIKKALVIFITTLMLILLCALIALYFALQGPYTTKLINHLLKQYSSVSASVYQADFEWPNHLSLQGVELVDLQEEPINIEQVDIWIHSNSIAQQALVFDSIKVNGVRLQHGLPTMADLKSLSFHQIAITNLDYSDGNLISRDTDIQITNPDFQDKTQSIPYGQIQFSADQIYWQNEAFDDVLINANYQADNSTIYGASLVWRGSDISTQAEQYKQGWSLVNATVDKLRLTNKQWDNIKTVDWSIFLNNLYHINSLDILNSSIETDMFNVTNGDLSLENITLHETNNYPKLENIATKEVSAPTESISKHNSRWKIEEVWQQEDAYVSFGAESIYLFNHLFLDPIFESYFDKDLISINSLSVEFEQGIVQAAGELTPNSAYFKDLQIDGMKWIYESPENLSVIRQYLSSLNNLAIDHLKVSRTQFIQLAQKPNWQFSGLSIDGNNLILVKDNKTSLWQGDIRLSANNASFQQLLTSHPLITMQSNNGIWVLDEAIIPLEHGLIDATASYNLTQPSQPWRMEVFADGLPIDIITQWIALPIDIQGLAEFQLGLSGLGGDELMLRHSLSGQLVGSLRESRLFEQQQSEAYSHSFESPDISIKADRGRIKLEPVILSGEEISGQFTVDIDLVEQNHNTVQLELKTPCSVLNYDLISHHFINHDDQEQSVCIDKQKTK